MGRRFLPLFDWFVADYTIAGRRYREMKWKRDELIEIDKKHKKACEAYEKEIERLLSNV